MDGWKRKKNHNVYLSRDHTGREQASRPTRGELAASITLRFLQLLVEHEKQLWVHLDKKALDWTKKRRAELQKPLCPV